MKALRAVYGKTLARLGAEKPEIVVLDADLSKSTKTSDFAKAFPKRFHDMGIAEQDMLATAAGMATAGLTPFASTFAIFGTGRAWEQLRNSVCYPELNVKLVATHGGITVGEDGTLGGPVAKNNQRPPTRRSEVWARARDDQGREAWVSAIVVDAWPPDTWELPAC